MTYRIPQQLQKINFASFRLNTKYQGGIFEFVNMINLDRYQVVAVFNGIKNVPNLSHLLELRFDHFSFFDPVDGLFESFNRISMIPFGINTPFYVNASSTLHKLSSERLTFEHGENLVTVFPQGKYDYDPGAVKKLTSKGLLIRY